MIKQFREQEKDIDIGPLDPEQLRPAAGVAIEVPSIDWYRGVLPSTCLAEEQEEPIGDCASCARAEQIWTPGDTRSGFMRPSRVGPIEENPAT